MISQVIDKINERLVKLFEATAGARVYGLAQTMFKTQVSETKVYPCLIDHTGEGKDVSVDDRSPVIIYHKSNSIATAIRTQEAYGNSLGSIQNTYSNTLIVYLNRKKIKKLPDEVFLYIQASFPETLAIEPFRVVVRVTNVILNSQQVWASEYQTDFKLPPEASLFAVNYTVESSFQKNCFDKCF